MSKESIINTKKRGLSQSDKDLIQGLIDRNPESERTFKKLYRKKIYNIIVEIHEKLEIKTKLTDKMKEDLFIALCENLHSSDDKQLIKFLEENNKTFVEKLYKKAQQFFKDKFIVNGLKNKDPYITNKVFYSDDKIFTFKFLFLSVIKGFNLRDFDHGGKPMTPEYLAQEISVFFFNKLDEFRFEASLKTFLFKNAILPFFNEYLKGLDIDHITDDIDEVFKIIDSCDFEKRDVKEHIKGVFDYMIKVKKVNQNYVDVLKYKYYNDMSNEEIAEEMDTTTELVAIWHHRAKKLMRIAMREYDRPRPSFLT